MVLSLIGPLDNHSVQRILLIAAYAGTKLKVVPITVGSENATESYARNCHPLRRVPVLKSDEGYLFEANAIIRYIARTERPYGKDGNERYPSPQHLVPYMLYGKSLHEAAEVDAWLDFVLTEMDPHIVFLMEMEKERKSSKTTAAGTAKKEEKEKVVVVGNQAKEEEALHEGLYGLEQRLVFKKDLKKLLSAAAGGGGGGNNNYNSYNNSTSTNTNNNNNNNNNRYLSARSRGIDGAMEEVLSEEELLGSATPRDSALLRGQHTYNIKTRTEESDQLNSPRNSTATTNSQTNNYYYNPNGSLGNENESVRSLSLQLGAPSPRSSITPRFSSYTSRKSGHVTSDMIFLVGDSLTAADLLVAFAVTQVLSLRGMTAVVKQKYPQLVRYQHAIMRLPLAKDVRKALGISII